MQSAPSTPPKSPNFGGKPVSEVWRPELTCLPRLTFWRLAFRLFMRGLCRLLVLLCTRPTVQGLANFPHCGPALLVMNHLGDPDTIIELAYFPIVPESIAKIELRNIPLLGAVIEALGVIWVHRGQPDRRAIEVVLKGFSEKRIVMIAPEGRESPTGALEYGTEGAAYLALKANVPIVPVTITGTENRRLFGCLKRLRRAPVTLTVGRPFHLLALNKVAGRVDRHAATREGTRLIMETLARQLPHEYRGAYAYVGDV